MTATPTDGFKVGDRVRVVGSTSSAGRIRTGQEGTIIELDVDDGSWPFRIELDAVSDQEPAKDWATSVELVASPTVDDIARRAAGAFVTKDSGQREEFASGMVRDTQVGKPRFDLITPIAQPYDAQLLTRWAALMGRGAEKYGDRNWEKANGVAERDRAKASAWRHFMQWYHGESDEDHAAAVLFNVQQVEYLKWRTEQ